MAFAVVALYERLEKGITAFNSCCGNSVWIRLRLKFAVLMQSEARGSFHSAIRRSFIVLVAVKQLGLFRMFGSEQVLCNKVHELSKLYLSVSRFIPFSSPSDFLGCETRQRTHQPKGCRTGWKCCAFQDQKAHATAETNDYVLWSCGAQHPERAIPVWRPANKWDRHTSRPRHGGWRHHRRVPAADGWPPQHHTQRACTVTVAAWATALGGRNAAPHSHIFLYIMSKHEFQNKA